MKNFVQPGNTIDIIAPSGGIVSGVGVRIVSLFGYAIATVAQTLPGVLQVEGVVDAAKLTADVMPVGTKVNWNNSNKELQLATSDLDGVATVVVAAGNGDTTVQVKLTPL